jgi:hypothetical protein
VSVTCVALAADMVSMLEFPAVIEAGLAAMLTDGLSDCEPLDCPAPHPATTARRGRIRIKGNLKELQREDRRLLAFIGNLINCLRAIFDRKKGSQADSLSPHPACSEGQIGKSEAALIELLLSVQENPESPAC